MHTTLSWAAAGLALVGLVHSVLGEVLVFRALRTRGIVPTTAQPLLRERQLRIVWASWHLVTLLGWLLAALLWRLAAEPPAAPWVAWTTSAIGVTVAACGLLVLYATRGRHPAWAVLLGIAALLWWG